MPRDRQSSHSPWLRRTDQATVALLTSFGLAAMALYLGVQGGLRGRLIEIDREPAAPALYWVDVNAAAWPEIAQLPDVGETLARRIVAERQAAGPYASHDDLLRVEGIGPRKLERIRPYLRPLPGGAPAPP